MQGTKMAIKVSLLRRKFRGCMLGGLAGDCLGSPYENDDTLSSGQKIVLQKSLDKLEGKAYKAPVMQFTDDSAMTRCVANSLLEKGRLDIGDVAKKFVASYYREPRRGYGPGVVTVFQKLRGNKFSDVLGPAKEQFQGRGSLGNGGAMRIAPVALFCHRDYDKLVEMTRRETEITHTHKLGVDGAILQAIAIQQCLVSDPDDQLDPVKFVDELIAKMDLVETDEEGLDLADAQPYKTQLGVVKKFVTQAKEGTSPSSPPPHAGKIVDELGNDVIAIRSVPTAIYCFLRAQKPIEGIQTDNPWRRAIQYAISLGGDTDTIGAMSGALAGAYYGETEISPALVQHCEASDDFRDIGDKLYEIATK